MIQQGLRLVLAGAMLWLCAQVPAQGQHMHAVAAVDPDQSGLSSTGQGAEITLGLSTPVPFRVFTLTAPDRLILDFQEVDWRGLNRDSFRQDDIVTDIRFGVFQPGWSRMVLDLAAPMIVKTAEMQTNRDQPRLQIALEPASAQAFRAAAASAQDTGMWLRKSPQIDLAPKRGLRIAIDPGHGGVDPGAVREGVMEKDLALAFSKELAAVISLYTPYEVVMIRDADVWVSLGERVRLARDAQSDLFLSVHSNTVTRGDASGASVYTLSDRASDVSSAKLAELENRADLSAGLGDHVEGDDVARVLVDLSRVDTNARSKIFADTLINKFVQENVGVLRSRPHRSAGFKVLKAHDIPSVLLELGFLSNARDRQRMQDENWRRETAIAIVKAIQTWVEQDKERAKLVLR